MYSYVLHHLYMKNMKPGQRAEWDPWGVDFGLLSLLEIRLLTKVLHLLVARWAGSTECCIVEQKVCHDRITKQKFS